MDLLDAPCRLGFEVECWANLPLRSAIEDNAPISRGASPGACRRVQRQPSVAANAPTELALVGRQSYDVILLDVEMPAMDGFELCRRIHHTTHNRTTPIVFITSHADLNARAQSHLCGGLELICKPFLPFEVTVKALTFALRHRLQNLSSAHT